LQIDQKKLAFLMSWVYFKITRNQSIRIRGYI